MKIQYNSGGYAGFAFDGFNINGTLMNSDDIMKLQRRTIINT